MALCSTTNLVMGQSSKSCIYALFLSQDVEIEHFFALWAALSKIMADFIGHETCTLGHWPKFQRWHIHSLLPRGSKLSSFSLYGQQFLRYWPIFKTVIFGMNSRSCTYTLFLLQRNEIELIFALRTDVSEIRANFQN